MAIAAYQHQPDMDAIVGLICQSIEHSNHQRLPDALACLDEGLLIHPGFFPCRVARATVYAEMERFEEALADLNHVLKLVQLPDVQAGFTRILERAMAGVEARLVANGDDGAAYVERGNLHSRSRNPAAALADYERALALGADHAPVHMARGNALYELGRFAAAAAAYECVLDWEGADAHAWCNRGNALQKLGRLREAMACYQRAIAVAPQLAEARLEQAHCLLALGEFAEGWRLFESRWQTAQLSPLQLPGAQPRWLGDGGLEGKTILLWAEQGYGDSIQFARFIPRVAAMADKVIVRLPEPLRIVLAGLDQRVTIIGDNAPLPPHDCHCPLMSLPLALGIDDELALAGAAYLRPDPLRVQAWQARLGPAARRRIGLAWAGRRAGAAGACNPSRDMPLAALLPLLAIDAQFICLQKEYSADDAALLARQPAVITMPQGLDHFADTAALIACLDLVLTVDTAVAHLAGALGKPCWLLLRRSSEWRWQLEREDSPWYASITIFRQQAEGDWDELVQRVAARAAMQGARLRSSSRRASTSA